MGLCSPAGVITASRQSVVASFSLANPRRMLRTVSAVWEGLCNVSRFHRHRIPAQGTVVPVGAGVTSCRGRQAAPRLRAGCRKEVRFSQVEEMWGKGSPAEGTAWRKTRVTKCQVMRYLGLMCHLRGLGSILLMWGMWPFDGRWEIPGTEKWPGREKAGRPGRRLLLPFQPENGESVVLMGRAQARFLHGRVSKL